eukprot:Opistho-2@36072
MRDFFVLHKSGECVYARNFDGDILDQNLVTGFFSSISTFTQALARQQLREVILENSKFVYRELFDYVLVARCDLEEAKSLVHSQLKDVQSLLELFFGPAENWTSEVLALDGVDDLIDRLFRRCKEEPSAVVLGFDQIYLDHPTRERLDVLLASLEDSEVISGSATMLVLDSAVLHSRMPLIETRMIMHYIKTRPLGNMTLRFAPVHSSGRWFGLYLVQMQPYVLVLLTNLQTMYHELAPSILSFETSLVESNLNLPVEESPLLLRHFATRDTVAFVYHNIRTGVTVAPELRPGPDVEKKLTLRAFWRCFADASPLLAEGGITDFGLTRDGYRFIARLDGIHEMYVLYPSKPTIC